MSKPSMQKAEIERLVTQRIIKETFEKTGKRYVPAAGSNRHIHLCRSTPTCCSAMATSLSLYGSFRSQDSLR